MITGSIVALATPFNNGKLDESRLRELVEFHIENKTDGILVAGCTGESFTLSKQERNTLLKVVKEQSKGRVPVLIGTGSCSTAEALEMNRSATELGADSVLVISPYGNKPSQSALIDYFTEISKVSPPVIVYNIPSRTGVNILPETMIQLADIPNIIGTKEASANLDSVSTIIMNRPDFIVYSGDDSLTLPMLSIGAKGVISTVANIAPRQMHDLCAYYFDGNIEAAKTLHYFLYPIIKALFNETNPVPLKKALDYLGFNVGECRPPLGQITERNKEILYEVLLKSGLIKR